MVEVGKQLKEYYTVENLSFTDNRNKRVYRDIVYANAEEIVTKVIDERGFIGPVSVKVMLDTGQVFF